MKEEKNFEDGNHFHDMKDLKDFLEHRYAQ